MKRIVLLLLLFMFVAMPLHAQVKGFGFGPRVGLNFADYTNSTGKSRTGLYAGMFIDYNVSRRWGFESGAYYSQQGNRNNAESGYVTGGADFNTGRTDHMFDYISVPLLAKFNIIGGFRIYAGAQVAYLMSAKRRINSPTISEIQKMSDINRIDISAVVGVGYHFKFGLDVSGSYSLGFYDVLPETPKNNNTNIFRVAVGWRFDASRK